MGKIPHAIEQQTPRATTTEPMSHMTKASVAQSACSATEEASAVRSLDRRGAPARHSWRRRPCSRRPAQAKQINSNILKQKKQKNGLVEMAPESVWRPQNVVCSGEDERTLDRRPLNLRFMGTWAWCPVTARSHHRTHVLCPPGRWAAPLQQCCSALRGQRGAPGLPSALTRRH